MAVNRNQLEIKANVQDRNIMLYIYVFGSSTRISGDLRKSIGNLRKILGTSEVVGNRLPIYQELMASHTFRQGNY